MDELLRGLLISLFAELCLVYLSIVLKDNKQKVAAVLAVVVLIVGITAFRQPILQYISKNSPPTPEFINISLKSYSELSDLETDLGLKPGLTYLLDIPFDVGWRTSTQCSNVPNQPALIQLDTNIRTPTDVYLLLQAGWGLVQYDGIEIGFVRLGFSNGSVFDTPLTLGVNIRDWAWQNSAAVRTVSSSSSRPAWTGTAADGTPGGIDVLTIGIPRDQQSLTLNSIQITDESHSTTGDINPCIVLKALTVKHWH